jgi:hypothetical protein
VAELTATADSFGEALLKSGNLRALRQPAGRKNLTNGFSFFVARFRQCEGDGAMAGCSHDSFLK